MGESVSTGPAVSAGPMLGAPGAPDPNFKAGPSVTYQGDTIPDPRYPILGAAVDVGSIRAHLDSPYILMTDAVPAASAATPVNIAAGANTVSGTPMTLVTAPSAGVTPNVPFYSFGNNVLMTSMVTLDMGFATVATTSGSNIATPAAGTIGLFSQGQQLVIGNAGAGGAVPMIATVNAVGPTTITLSLNMLSTQSAAPVGQGNILNPLLAPTSIATAWTPYTAAGIAALFNPLDGVSRGVGIACSATGGGGAFTIRSYDIYGQPMSETLTHPGGAVVVYGKKAHKHIMSVTPAFTDGTRTYSVGTSDVFGFAVRNDKWEYDNFYVAGTFLSVNTGWTQADTTSPATSITGDVRGTIQVGSRGPLGSGAAGGPITGSQRIALFATIPAYNLTQATPTNPVPMYGQTQA